MSKYKFSRREFLGSLPCIALGTTTLYSSLINLKALGSIMNTTMVDEEYKALVCVMLLGGNDSFNMIIPRGNAEYNEYADTRGNIAIPKAELLDINPLDGDGRSYGLHPNMPGCQSLFEQGNMAFVCNVGTLVEPSTKSAIESGQVSLPLGLFSHSDQQMHWQTAIPQDRSSVGWGGRMADILKSMNVDNGVSMNISLAGTNVFQRGNEVTEYAINPDGGVSVLGWGEDHPFTQLMTEDISSFLNKQYGDIFKDSYTGVLKRSVESNEVFNQAIADAYQVTTPFTEGSKLSGMLRMVAQSIAARDILGAKRQIFFVGIGGFDNHDDLIDKHSALMTNLDDALTEFYAATQELGIAENVTTYTVSDFGRKLGSNGNGTDHAWGGNALVMGGAVNGKRMYGEFPVLATNGDMYIKDGVLIPTTSADMYFAELALWFGISPNDLSLILPNIGNFYDVSSGSAPLGILG